MRKIGWILIILVALVLGLVGCGPKAPKALKVPDGAMKVGQVFEEADLKNMDLNVLKVLEYHREYLVIELNGVKKVIVHDSDLVANDLTVLYFNQNGLANYDGADMFEPTTWRRLALDTPSLEFYVFDNGYKAINEVDTDTWAMNLVVAPKDKFPKIVDPRAWQGTEATIQQWRYPTFRPNIVENVTTGEIAFVLYVTAVDKDGNIFYLDDGSLIWGYLSVTEDTGNWSAMAGVPNLEISQNPIP